MLDLPDQTIGLHIRAGDKVEEAEIFGPDAYMTLVNAHTNIKNIFVLTDDYANYQYLVEHYPEFRFYTLCGSHERGYDFATFKAQPKSTQFAEYAKLLASMEVLSKCQATFGSYKTNPGMFLGMRIGNRFVGIDSDRWLLSW